MAEEFGYSKATYEDNSDTVKENGLLPKYSHMFFYTEREGILGAHEYQYIKSDTVRGKMQRGIRGVGDQGNIPESRGGNFIACMVSYCYRI